MKKVCILLVILISTISLKSNSQSVILGNGTAISVFSPLNRTNDYCVYEVIYLSTQINLTGVITNLGFQRHDGTNTDSIENVSIYLKHTLQTQLAAGNYDTSGYTLVFSGSFPHDTGAGWREVNLYGAFNYNGTDNLQVLVSKGYQLKIANTPVTPRWIYTNISPSPARARRYYDDIPMSSSTQLSITQYTSNARLTFGTTGFVEFDNLNLTVYPNPSKDEVHFKIDSDIKNGFLQLTNTMGQLVYEATIENNESLTVSGLPGGIYFYSITTNEQTIFASGKILVTP